MDGLPSTSLRILQRSFLGTLASRIPLAPLTAVLGLSLGMGSVMVATGSVAVASPTVSAIQDTPDQIWRKDPRNGRIRTLQGTVTVNSLSEVRIETGDRENKYTSGEVLEIQWGSVPPSYRDGKLLAERNDYEAAVASYRTAAGDASGREVVQAEARFRAAEVLLKWGAQDPAQFKECVGEVDRFLSDHSKSARVPEARFLKARALHLDGDSTGAAAGFQSLFESGATGDVPGYDKGFCLDAGLQAAWASLDAGDTQSARSLFTSLGSGYAGLIGEKQDAAPLELQRLRDAADVVSTGEGFCRLKGDQTQQARSFFESKARDRNLGAAGRSAAGLGLAQTLLAEGKYRKAQIEFARVAALDHTSRDRTARANVGFAEATMQLGDGDSADEARRRLTLVVEQYGDTPAAKRAATLLN
jgi:TolA-binding protein